MLRWPVLISQLALALTFPTAHARPLSEAEHWLRTQFPPALAARFLNNEKCHASETALRACRAALRTAQTLAGTTVDTERAQEFEQSIAGLEAALGGLVPVQMFRAKVVNAFLATFDAHAEIKPSSMFEQSFAAAKQNYVGIGVVLEPTGDGILVREVHANSPAAKAGIREDDVIVAVAKHGRHFEFVGADMEKTADLIRGPAAMSVTLRLMRGESFLDIPVVRAAVSVPYVTGSVNNGLGYLRIYSFESQAVCPKVIRQLNQMLGQGLRKLILDLRGNPGGEKGMAVCVAELFLGTRAVVGTKSVGNSIPGLYEIMKTDESLLPPPGEMIWEGGFVARVKFGGPMVVLVDALSASGSEIVAGALQDYGRAWLIGERTSGKGTVQNEEFIPEHSSLTLKHTIERFYQPSGRTNQAVGLIPSFEVPRRKGQDLNETKRLREIDLFPGSLAPENTAWTETRPDEVARINACVSSRVSVENLDSDFQRAFAGSVLACM